jgi:hypothetical protein
VCCGARVCCRVRECACAAVCASAAKQYKTHIKQNKNHIVQFA